MPTNEYPHTSTFSGSPRSRPSSLHTIAKSLQIVAVSMYPPTSCCIVSSVLLTAAIRGSSPGSLITTVSRVLSFGVAMLKISFS